jgi:hypothetical protein
METDAAVIEALDERFQERLDQVPVLRQRADDEGIKRIESLDDLVPLLFPHTVYKSYPAALVDQGRWAQLNRWLDSVSATRIDVDVAGVEDLDGWIQRLVDHGIYVSASSGTSGKSSFLTKTSADLDATSDSHFRTFEAAGIEIDHGWHLVSLSPNDSSMSGRRQGERMQERMARPDNFPRYPLPPRTEGHLAFMTRLARVQRAMVDGTAAPDEIAAVETESAARQALTERILEHNAEQILGHADERILLGTMLAMAWRLVEALRARGAKPGDLTADNVVYMAGGTKGVTLPADAEEQICELLHVRPERFIQIYSMQEINVGTARCLERRYHMPPELVLLVLDEPGERLAPIAPDGRVEGRAAFFDFTVDGRWGGTISGDKVTADFGPCPCGQPGATVHPDITRFANLADGDKITCAGTMDAYVRGIIAPG